MADGYTSGGTIVPEYWVREVHRGKQYRKSYAKEDRWIDWRRWYRGDWRKGILPSNVYFKMIRTLVPRVYFRNPSVSITAKKPGPEQQLLAKLIERVDNTLLDSMGIKGQMKKAVLWTTMFGTSGLKLGYGAEFTPTPEPLGTSDPDVGGRRIQKRVEYNDLVHPNAPWALAVHPSQLIVPATCANIHEARWVCNEVTRPIDDVMDDPRFENTKQLQDGLRGAGGGHRAEMLAKGSSFDRMRDGVLLWEIRDKKTGMVFVMAPYSNASPQGKVLFREVDELQINRRVNFYPMIFNEDDEVFWGIPDSQILEPQQMEKNEVRTQMMYHRRVALCKLLYEEGNIRPDELSKLLADDNDQVAVGVKNISGVREMNAPPMPDSLPAMDAFIDREVQELLGLGVNQFGEYAPGSADRSATEASIVNQATMIRIDERRDICADLLTYLTSDMNHIIAERWDQDMIVQVAGPEGLPLWVQFQPQLIRDIDYDIKIDPDTSVPLTKQLREQRAMALFQLYNGDPLIDQVALRRHLNNEMYGVDVNHLLINPNQPGASQQNPMPFGMAAQQFGQAGQGPPRPTPVQNLIPAAGGRRG